METLYRKAKKAVKNEIGKVQPSGFKLLTNYYPKYAEDTIDDIFSIIERFQPIEPQEQFEKFSLLKQTESVTSDGTVLKAEPKQTAEEVLELTYRDKWIGSFTSKEALNSAIRIVKICEEWDICVTAIKQYAQNKTKEQVSTCVDCDKEKDTHSICAECLDKLIKQNQQPEGSVTDEEIKKLAVKLEFGDYDSFWDAFIDGAKWMRDKLKRTV